MNDSTDKASSDGWHEATGAERDAVAADLLRLRENALSADSGRAALGYELDEDGEILWWVSPMFLMRKGPWAPDASETQPDEEG
jgi:hypothetical protein